MPVAPRQRRDMPVETCPWRQARLQPRFFEDELERKREIASERGGRGSDRETEDSDGEKLTLLPDIEELGLPLNRF